MSLLVVGSVALDTIETPSGKVEEVFGGSASFFSTAASFFTRDIRLVAVVGEDFPKEHVCFLRDRGVDLGGLVRVQGNTFRWRGRYGYDLNVAETLETRLNVYADFKPILPESFRDSDYVFLANINPELQLEVLRQITKPKLVACDTMNLWIDTRREELVKTLSKVDIVILNDAEARALAREANLIRAARAILRMGPTRVIIKKGEHGAISVTDSSYYVAPAYPVEEVLDPTGAGDSFAGGVMGYLAAADSLDEATIKKAINYGVVTASFSVQGFGLEGLRKLAEGEIDCRFNQICEIVAI